MAKARLYVGTFTSGESRGIYNLQLDLVTGRLRREGEPAETVSPAFLALHPSQRFLYAVNHVGKSRGESGAISAFAVDPNTGDLSFLNRQPSGGGGPCHLSLDDEGRNLFVANYWGGSVSVLPVLPDGRLGEATSFVQHEGENLTRRPHAHFIALDAKNRFALVADLGLDSIFVYRFDPGQRSLTPHPPGTLRLAAGSGPRHLAFPPDGACVYAVNELASTLTVLTYDPERGTLSEVQTVSTLPAGFEGHNASAEVVVRPDGKFLYASNRGHDSLAIFARNAATGKLTLVGHQPSLGKTPRHFAIEGTGTCVLVANEGSDTVVAFRIHAPTGLLEAVAEHAVVPRPVCVLVVPSLEPFRCDRSSATS